MTHQKKAPVRTVSEENEPATKRPTRNASLAEQLAGLMAYRNRPEGPIEPMGSNWSTVASNDNASADEIADLSQERELRMTPSVKEIMRQVETGDVEKNAKGQTIRIGNLHFSDGMQTEKAFKRGADGKVTEYDRVMPIGAMLGCREKAETALGGKGYSGAYLKRSNAYFAASLDTDMPTSVKRSKRRNGAGHSKEALRAMLDEAIANTAVMPEVKHFPAGLPSAGERVADSFNGMKVSVTGGSSSIAWQDISGAIIQREIWDAALEEMKAEDVATLDRAMEAKTLADLSEGKKGGNAFVVGKKRLEAANDNLSAALKKVAS